MSNRNCSQNVRLGWQFGTVWIKNASRMAQLLLLPDPRPLDRRLGGKFFRNAPRRPGVYLMKDAHDKLLYVGKAKDLKQRLGNYRIANPDRMPRRHLKMVNAVARIDFQFCRSEAAALKHEKKLIRSLKPKFNRAGVWPGKPRFICWRVNGEHLEITVKETPAAGWHRYGSLGGEASHLQRTIARLLWLALNPERELTQLPAGWMRGDYMETVSLKCGDETAETVAILENFFWKNGDEFILWLGARFTHRIVPFERRIIEAELESLKEFSSKKKPDEKCRAQLVLL
jgi:predicted GIY-YIG superfamily endonuclease